MGTADDASYGYTDEERMEDRLKAIDERLKVLEIDKNLEDAQWQRLSDRKEELEEEVAALTKERDKARAALVMIDKEMKPEATGLSFIRTDVIRAAVRKGLEGE